MANWLPQSVKAKLGDDLSQIDWKKLQSLVGLPEDEDLEFKQQMWPSEKNVELASDIAQFANHRGGLIIVGAEDDDGKLANLVPLELTETDELRIQHAISTRVSPRPKIYTRRVDINDGGSNSKQSMLLIFIPASKLKPHAISEHHRLSYPIRTGSGKHYLNESEVADLYAQRHENHVQIRERLEFLLSSAAAQFDDSEVTRIALVCAAVPQQPGYSDLESDSVRQVQRYAFEAFAPQGDWSLHNARSGFRSVRLEMQAPGASVFEFSLDGSGFAMDGLDFGLDGDIYAERIALSALNCISLFSQHAYECGAGGSLFLLCQIVGDPGHKIGLRTDPRYGIRGWPAIELPTPIAERELSMATLATDGKELFSVWRHIASDLTSPFGLANPIPMDNSQALNPNSYLGHWRSDFERLGIPIADA